MDSWQTETPSPDVKFEASPAESFLSMPGEMYPPLFGTPAPTSATMNPQDIMTPRSVVEDNKADISVLAGLSVGLPPSSSPAPTQSSEKKPVKKRKSWGQVLPEPKTNLPPRKRAKTEDEKEQRRVERVLRNRRAAQSSRERKRQEVDALEQRNKDLEAALLNAQKANMMLCQELSKLRGNSGVVARNPITFSQELFSSQDGHGRLVDQSKPSLDELLMTSPSQTTINPISLSPALTPVPDAMDSNVKNTDTLAVEATHTVEAAADVTQHPAVVLCPDLQCQSAAVSRTWMISQQALSPGLALYCQLTLLLASTSTLLSICRRPLTQIAMSLKAGFSLPPTPALLNTIVWLVTRPSPSRTATSTLATSSTTRLPSPRAAMSSAVSRSSRLLPTLRLKLLRKILTSSPMLARPLMDATMAALRLVHSEGTLGVDRVSTEDDSPTIATLKLRSPGEEWPKWASLPSQEALLTLMWALKVEGRRLANLPGQVKTHVSTHEVSPCSLQPAAQLPHQPHQKYVLRVSASKRSWDACEKRQNEIDGSKRRRYG